MTVRGRQRWRRRAIGLAAVLLLAGPLAAEESLDLDELDALLERMQQRIEGWDAPGRPEVEPPLPEHVDEPVPTVVPERVVELEAAIEERDDRIAQLQEEIEGLRAQLTAEDDGDSRVTVLEQDLATARAQRTGLEMRLNAALARQEELERRLEAEAARLAELERQRDQARDEVAAAAADDGRLEELQGEIDRLRAELAAASEDDPQLAQLEEDLATARAQRTSLEMRLNAALARQAELERRLEAETARMAELERQRDQARDEVAAADADDGRLEELQGEIDRLRAELAATPEDDPQLAQLEEDLATARAQRTGLEMRLEAALARQEELERRLEAEAARGTELERQRDQVRAELAALEARPPRAELPRTDMPAASPLQRVHELVRVAMSRAQDAMVRLSPERPGNRIAEGQLLMLEIEVPDGYAHLQVDYFKADGRVAHLREATPDQRALGAGRPAMVGDPLAGDWFEIAPPFGEELVLVVASPAPLFERRRPESEDARSYLEALALAIERLPARPLAATLAIETVPDR